MPGRIRAHIRNNVVGYIALFVALGGTAYAGATITGSDVVDGSLTSADYKNSDIRTGDLSDAAVKSRKVADGSLLGQDFAPGELPQADTPQQVLDKLLQVDGEGSTLSADLLDGSSSNAFLHNSTYRQEAPTSQGTLLGDGSRVQSAGCLPGDRLVGGGPASVSAASDVLDSFPNASGEWQARINDNGQVDNFTVVVLCVSQDEG